MQYRKMSFELKVGKEKVPIEMLLRFFANRRFDFEYKLAENKGKPILVENQKLCEEALNPIKVEPRKIGGQSRDFLVFYVEDPDDLLVSTSDWDDSLRIDFSNDDQGVVTIKNFEGDRYKFKIRSDTKN